VKALIIGILAIATLVLSAVFMPWTELGFGLDKEEITDRSMLRGPLNAFAAKMEPMNGLANDLKTNVVNNLNEEVKINGGDPSPKWDKAVKAGNYAYVLFMAAAMTTAALAIMMIGVEDAEEKTILPVKK